MAKSIQPRERGVSKPRIESKLTANQRMFLENLLATNPWNPTEAARKAGYKNPPSSAIKLMKDPIICGAVGRAIQERIWRCELDANRVIQELSTIAFANIKELFDEDGLLVPIHMLPDSIARAVQSVEVKTIQTEDGSQVTTAKIKLEPKLTAIELLMKHMGMLDSKFQVEQQTSTDMLSNILKTINQSNNLVGDEEIEVAAQQRLLESNR